VLDALCTIVVGGNVTALRERLETTPSLAGLTFETEMLVTEIPHQLYTGDTLLHLAAAAIQPAIARSLVEGGGKVDARNRRGAQPLHYACDPRPAQSTSWSPTAQEELIRFLIAAGADPNEADASGATPLHRAVRARSPHAVRALLAAGADPNVRAGRNGSTPLKLAQTSSGASGTAGSGEARDDIVAQLVAAGASA
jgi:ankyrin repeat protein